jgi:hypothetical protein
VRIYLCGSAEAICVQTIFCVEDVFYLLSVHFVGIYLCEGAEAMRCIRENKRESSSLRRQHL